MTPALPPVLAGARRGLMARLVVLAVGQALAAMATALLVGALVDAARDQLVATTALLLGAVAATGATTYGARVVAERLGQDYVHELRGLLVRSALTGSSPSLGITIARVTNDLTSVRGWVAQGIGPLVAAVPLVVAALVVLGAQDPTVAVAAMIPLTVMGTAAAVLMPWAYGRARRLRRVRGRLASRLTDTLQAREGVLAAGGEAREARRLDRASRRVADAAVDRARAAGSLQAVAAATAASIAVLVVATGLGAGLSAGRLATALTVAGVLAAPLTETGRIAELRQNFRAARRILAPLVAAVAAPDPATDPATGRAPDRAGPADGRVVVDGLLEAGPGERVRLAGPDAARVLRGLAAPDPDRTVVVDGWPCGGADPRRRRELVGLAAAGVPLERGTVARVLRYRRPDADPADTTQALDRVGLGPTVAALPAAERTELRRGGEPLSPGDLARLKLARASYGDPPLLLLDRLDAELDADGRATLRRVVAAHPGVVVFTSDDPGAVAEDHRTVTVG